jgi:hypothetical protein
MPINSLGLRRDQPLSKYCHSHECLEDGCVGELVSSENKRCSEHACSSPGCEDRCSKDDKLSAARVCHEHSPKLLYYRKLEEERKEEHRRQEEEHRRQEEERAAEIQRQAKEDLDRLLSENSRLRESVTSLTAKLERVMKQSAEGAKKYLEAVDSIEASKYRPEEQFQRDR